MLTDDILARASEEIYESVFGEILTDEKAKSLVQQMKPYGENWTLEEANKAIDCDCLPSSKYFTINMMYNDYHALFDENTEKYVEISKLWLNDIDAVGADAKTYRYAIKV